MKKGLVNMGRQIGYFAGAALVMHVTSCLADTAGKELQKKYRELKAARAERKAAMEEEDFEE